MTFVALLGAFLTVLLAGCGLALVLWRGRREVNAAEWLALGWILGSALVSLGLWLGGLVLRGAVLQMAVGGLALGLGAVGFALLRRGACRLVLPRPRGGWDWFFFGLIALQFGYVFYLSFQRGIGWDGLLNWEIKARYAFLNDGVLPAAYFADTTRAFTHPAYPLWIPFTELWFYLWLGEPDQFWINLISPCFYIAGAILLAIIARRLSGQRWIGLIVAALLFFIPALLLEGGAASGYADVPLGACYLAAVGYLLLYLERGESTHWRIYAVALALLPWAKRDGIILWGVGALGGLFVLWRVRPSWRALLWLVPGPVLVVAWKSYLGANDVIADGEYLAVTWARLQANLMRAWPLAHGVLAEMLNTTRWSLFWPICALGFLSLLWRGRDRRLAMLTFAIVAPLAIYPAAYLFSSWEDWLGHAQASFGRLLFHVLPLAWVTIALALRPPSSGR